VIYSRDPAKILKQLPFLVVFLDTAGTSHGMTILLFKIHAKQRLQSLSLCRLNHGITEEMPSLATKVPKTGINLKISKI